MKLKIEGFESFDVQEVEIANGIISVDSTSLVTYITKLREDLTKANAAIASAPEPDTMPAAPPKVEYVPADNLPFSIEQYKASGWTEQQLISAGHLVEKVVEPVPAAPAIPPAPAATVAAPPPESKPALLDNQFEVDGDIYNLLPVAGAATYEQFKNAGWTIETLLRENYISKVGGDVPAATIPEVPAVPSAATEKEYPFLNAAGDWEDKAGTVFDINKHSWSEKEKKPVCKKNGEFAASRRRTPAKEEPTTPAVPDAPAGPATAEVPAAPLEGEVIPAAPSVAPSAATVPEVPAAPEASVVNEVADDEPLDEELANIIKGWNT